jgi:hypothetical protein
MAHFKAYISGAISGHPIDTVREKFKQAAISVSDQAEIVYNPCEDRRTISLEAMHRAGAIDNITLWTGCMRICIQELATCDVIYMLPDWKFSRGAKIEHELAVNLKLEINYL